MAIPSFLECQAPIHFQTCINVPLPGSFLWPSNRTVLPSELTEQLIYSFTLPGHKQVPRLQHALQSSPSEVQLTGCAICHQPLSPPHVPSPQSNLPPISSHWPSSSPAWKPLLGLIPESLMLFTCSPLVLRLGPSITFSRKPSEFSPRREVSFPFLRFTHKTMFLSKMEFI